MTSNKMEPAPRSWKILVINPNTSVAITKRFEPFISDADIPGISTSYWTCPTGPSVITSQAELEESTNHCIGPLMELADEFDGFLVAGYGDLPLVPLLRSRIPTKPVVGIFDASVFAALRLVAPDSKFGIVTTGVAYQDLLSDGVERLLRESGETGVEQLAKFGGVVATGIAVQDLTLEASHIAKEKVMAATMKLVSSGDLNVVSMGGVILAGMESWVHEACELALGPEKGSKVKVIEQLVAGVLCLDAQLRHDSRPSYVRALA